MTPQPAAIVHQGDSLNILPTMPAVSIDCVLTDPPYNSGGRTPKERTGQTARGKYVRRDAGHDLADFAGDSRDQRGYLAWLSLLLAECLRVARPGASCLVFSDFRQLPTTSDALQAGGWTWRGIIPWRKPISRPQRDGFKRECEYVLWGSHGQPHRQTPSLYLPGWVEGSQPRASHRKHITQKPLAVMRELVRICPPDGTVLDPCAGSGTTLVAALAEGRRAVGIEVTEHYAMVARERVAQMLTEPSLAG